MFYRNTTNMQVVQEIRNECEFQNIRTIRDCNPDDGFRRGRSLENHSSMESEVTNMMGRPENMVQGRGRRKTDDIYYDEPVIFHKCIRLVKSILNIRILTLQYGTICQSNLRK